MGLTTETLRADYGPIQAARALDLTPRTWRRLVEAGYIAPPDVDGRRWSAHKVIAAAEVVRYVIADGNPIGATKAGERIAFRLGRPRWSIDNRLFGFLVEAGALREADTYKDHALYDRAELDRLTAADLEAAAAARQAWIAASLTDRDAAAWLGWNTLEFTNATWKHGLRPGAEDRWARTDVATLAGDGELAAAIAGAATLGPDQAAAHLEIRRVDFDALVESGRLAPVVHVEKDVGRVSTVRVPLYRVDELDAAAADATIDWAAVRATAPGRPSPLRALAGRRPDRPAAVRRFAAALADEFGIETWTHYRKGGARWQIDWADVDGTPTVADVEARLDADPALAGDDRIEVQSVPGRVARWARAMLRPGAAAIVDTETNGLWGHMLQIAVIDAADGTVLLNSLVNPGEVTWDEEAQCLHGIGPGAVEAAPSWPEIHDRVLAAIGERQIVAYNADYDRTVLRDTARAHNLSLGAAGTRKRWDCAMEALSEWYETTDWFPLGGNHDAVGDCRATREVLQDLTRPPWAAQADTDRV